MLEKPNAHALDALIQALRILPGVGAKSASRMAFHLMQHERTGALQLAKALTHACDHVRHCSTCHTLTESEICNMCADSKEIEHSWVWLKPPQTRLPRENLDIRGLYLCSWANSAPGWCRPKVWVLKKLSERCSDGRVKK